MNSLTPRQQQVLQFIRDYVRDHGFPPTMRDIAAGFGFKSTNAAATHVTALEKKGAIRREGRCSRGITITESGFDSVGMSTEVQPEYGNVIQFHAPQEPVAIPIIGHVAAGLPLLAEEHIEETLLVDPFFTGGRRDDMFGLVVNGDSMIEAGIHDGDYVFVRVQRTARPGEIIIAMIDGETTCKYYYPEARCIRLQPANRTMSPIFWYPDEGREFSILGTVIGVYRRM
jgi:repressor LexA